MNYTAEEIVSAINSISSGWQVSNDMKAKALDTLAHIMTNVKPPQNLQIRGIGFPLSSAQAPTLPAPFPPPAHPVPAPWEEQDTI